MASVGVDAAAGGDDHSDDDHHDDDHDDGDDGHEEEYYKDCDDDDAEDFGIDDNDGDIDGCRGCCHAVDSVGFPEPPHHQL